ncbi:hypothetical protein ACXHXG_30525 [Rhizobium sp. LEGMi198b]
MNRVTEPGVGRDGRTLLYRVRVHQHRTGKPYPLSGDRDARGAAAAIHGAYARRAPCAPNAVTLTLKGGAYLDRLLRCE